ncbi:MAG: hypothetical protein AB7H70_09675 [Rhodospirillaceae bacterium]
MTTHRIRTLGSVIAIALLTGCASGSDGGRASGMMMACPKGNEAQCDMEAKMGDMKNHMSMMQSMMKTCAQKGHSCDMEKMMGDMKSMHSMMATMMQGMETMPPSPGAKDDHAQHDHDKK